MTNAPLAAVQPKTYSDEILQMVHRIDQHLDVMEEKIDNAPVRTESPKLNLMEAQLEAMKAAMEAMHLEKERQEQEAKKKVEDEIAAAKLRAEQEEARELAVFKKESQIKLHGLIYPNGRELSYSVSLSRCRPFLIEMEKSGEILIESLIGPSVENMPREYEFFITDRHIYYLVYDFPEQKTTNKIKFVHISKLYSFHAPLNSAYCKLLKNVLESRELTSDLPLKRRICYLQSYIMICESELSYHRKKFESVVRVIPGSYQNGDWRQLDGFFGMYYNEKTMEVSEYPPCSQ